MEGRNRVSTHYFSLHTEWPAVTFTYFNTRQSTVKTDLSSQATGGACDLTRFLQNLQVIQMGWWNSLNTWQQKTREHTPLYKAEYEIPYIHKCQDTCLEESEDKFAKICHLVLPWIKPPLFSHLQGDNSNCYQVALRSSDTRCATHQLPCLVHVKHRTNEVIKKC